MVPLSDIFLAALSCDHVVTESQVTGLPADYHDLIDGWSRGARLYAKALPSLQEEQNQIFFLA